MATKNSPDKPECQTITTTTMNQPDKTEIEAKKKAKEKAVKDGQIITK